MPIWSPDSKTVAFHANGKLNKINVNGGVPQPICDVSTFLSGGSWSRENVIVFGDLRRGIMRVPASGGPAVPLTAIDRGESFQTFPVFLPDGRHFLYHRSGGPEDVNGIYTGSIDAEPSKQSTKRLLDLPQVVQVISLGDNKVKLVYLRNRTLVVQDFDAAKLQLTGEAAIVAEQVGNSLVFGFHAASANTLAYRTPVAENIQLHWFDRQGKQGQAIGEPFIRQSSVALSPGGDRALVFRLEQQSAGIWVLDLRREVFLRLTTGSGMQSAPVWSPEGKRFAFASNVVGPANIRQGFVDGDVISEPLFKSSGETYPLSWSADGRFVLYTTNGPKTKADLWILPVVAGHGGTPFPFSTTPASESDGSFSPDERWIAYTSDETGSLEIYVRSFAPSVVGGGGESQKATGLKTRVSTSGGKQPHWRRDGKELFYVAGDEKLMAVTVRSGSSFQADNPQALFSLPAPGVWDVAADGKRFLVGVPVEQRGQVPFTVVMNWMTGLNR